ncbi:MAG TPA: hypothetical protein VGK73_03290 [Polyangiaceae bacterium]
MSFTAAPVHAEPAPAADALFRAGRDAAKRGEIHNACAMFRESYRLDAALGTRLNLALCEEDLGRLAEALAHLRALSHAFPNSDPRAALVSQHLAALEYRVPRLVLTTVGELPPYSRVEGAGMTIPDAGLGVTIPLNPGKYVFRLISPGSYPREYSIELHESERRTLVFAPGRAISERTPAAARVTEARASTALHAEPRRESARSHTLRTAGTIALGVAASSLIASMAAGFSALKNKDAVQQLCTSDGDCPPAGVSAARAGESAATIATVTFVASVALAAGGVTLLLVAGSSRERGPTPSSSRAPVLHATLSGILP